MSETFPLCPNPTRHPGRAQYYLQHYTSTNDGVSEEDRKRARDLLCPWCDWEKLRRSGYASSRIEAKE